MEEASKAEAMMPVKKIKFFVPFYIVGILFFILALIFFINTIGGIANYYPFNFCDTGRLWDLSGLIVSLLLFMASIGLFLIKKWAVSLYGLICFCPIIFAFLDNYAYDYCSRSQDIGAVVFYFVMFILSLFFGLLYFLLKYCYKKIKIL